MQRRAATGDRQYGYFAELADGSVLAAATASGDADDYEANKAVLDERMRTLELGG